MSGADSSPSVPAWSLRNPAAIFAVYVGLVVAALAAVLFLLPTRMMPYVPSPLISVVTMTPGFSAEETATYFSKPIEERMTDLKGVRFIRSASQDGLSTVVLQFPYGADMQRALVDVGQLVKQAEGDLPYDRANLKPSYVVPVDPLNTPVLQLAVRGVGWDAVRLREFVANDVVRDLKGIDGVQNVYPFGGLLRQLRVVADRDALASYGLSLLDVRDALDRQNVSRSGGTLTGGGRESIVRADQRLGSASDLLDYPVSTTADRTVYVRDVARASDGAAEQRAAYRFNGTEGVEVSVVENPDASSPRVIAAVNERLRAIERDHPGVTFTPAYDNARFVGTLTRNMVEELVISVLLAGFALLLFLEDVSATVIVMTSIPTCLGLAVLLFVPMHLSINSSTLVGLLLAIGRLVDDSIVVIHAVHRRLAQGLPPRRAAVEGTLEVILPIAAATGVMVLALAPLLLSGGITQIMFVGLVWPIVFALVASLLVSVTLTPLLAAYLFRAADAAADTGRARFDAAVRRALAPTRNVLARVEISYRGALRWSLRNAGAVVAVAAVLTYAALQLFPLIGSEMMPLADTGQASAYFETTPGSSFAATSEKAKAFERILQAQPEVQRVSGEIGEPAASGYVTGTAMNGPNAASYLITLSPKEERRRTIWQIMDAVYAQTTRSVPGVRRLALKEMGSDVMASNDAPVELLVTGPELATVERLAEHVAAVARDVPGMVQVSTSSSMLQPQDVIAVDRTRAAQLGLAPADVTQQAYYATHGGLTTEYFNPQGLRHDTILLRYAQTERANSTDLGAVQIVGKNGTSVPLSSIAQIRRGLGPTLIEHDGLRPSVSVLGYYRKGGRGEMALDMDTIMGAMAQIPFPHGYGIEMRGDMTEMMQSFDRLLGAMKVAALFVFLLLVAQFRSVANPAVMLFAIPLELLGVFGGLLLAHQHFSTVSILGIVVANGMAVSNAILLLDLILRNRGEGMTRTEAIAAAGPVRLRPILMTTIVSLVVLAPVAFFPKTGIDAYAPLATVIIGGLTVSTALTLFVVPVLYALFDDLGVLLRERFRSRRSRAAGGAQLGVLALVLAAAMGAPAHAQPAPERFVTLVQALERARTASFDVRIARADAAMAAADAATSRATLRPQLSVSANALDANEPQLGMPVARQTYAAATLTVPLAAASAARTAHAAAVAALGARSGVEASARDAVFAAAQAYRRVQLAAAILAARRSAVDDQQAHLRATEQRAAAGKVARYVVSRDRAALAAALQAGEDAAAERDQAGNELIALLDLDGPVAVEPLERAAFSESRESVAARAVRVRPSLIAADLRVTAAAAGIDASLAAYRPSAALTAQTYNGASSPMLGRGGAQISVSATLPIADGGARGAAAAKARAEYERAVAVRDQVRAGVVRDVANAWREYEAATRNSALATAAVADAQEQLRVASLRETAGKAIATEVLDALALVASARETLARTVARYDIAVAAIHHAAGDAATSSP